MQLAVAFGKVRINCVFWGMISCRLTYNNKTLELQPSSKMQFFEELYVDFKLENVVATSDLRQAQRCQLTIHPKQDNIRIEAIELVRTHRLEEQDQIFCNGFQSWSESRWYSLEEKIASLHPLARPFMGYYGDYHLDVPRGKGILHSWMYAYFFDKKGIDFIGSLEERSAFSLIVFDQKKQEIRVQKDCRDLVLLHSYPALDIVFLKGEEQAIFDRYFELMQVPPPSAPPTIGWTSWYHYYTDISAEIIRKNLTAFEAATKEHLSGQLPVFQIDDGYQTKVGDWLSIKTAFPNGMATIAQAIHEKGYKAGLWLAPFICEKESDIFKNKKDWLLKDAKGKPVKVGYNPLWSGWFYALDFYNGAVQEYLTGVFFTVLQKWNYDFVKLDFLYAVSVLPRPHKTRGQVQYDALQFLRTLVGDKYLLACGVPLGSSFGLVDYCRIGADIHLEWEHTPLRLLRHRERVSTIVALRTVLARWQLNQRAFINDPDVFILRKAKNKLTPTQQYTILIINTLVGDLLFTSDYLKDYDAETLAEYQSIFKWQNSTIKSVQQLDFDHYAIVFTNETYHYIAFCNLTKKAAQLSYAKQVVDLEAFETVILKEEVK